MHDEDNVENADEEVTAAEAMVVAKALVDKVHAPKAKKKKKKKVDKQSTTTFAYPPALPAATMTSTITTGTDDIGSEETVALVLDDDANLTSVDDLDYPRMEEKDDEITEKVGYTRFMLDDVWSIGWERLERDDVRETHQLAEKRIKRKRIVTEPVIELSTKRLVLMTMMARRIIVTSKWQCGKSMQ